MPRGHYTRTSGTSQPRPALPTTGKVACADCGSSRGIHVMTWIFERDWRPKCPTCWTEWLKGEAKAQAKLEAKAQVRVDLSTHRGRDLA